MPNTILVVDDEPLYLKLIKANLLTEDYQVITTLDGEEALNIVAQERIDLILLDVMLPNIDGYAVCERIREFSSVPIIMVTVRGSEKDRVKGLNLGADDYIVKPFSAIELLARVHAVLRRAQSFPSSDKPAVFNHQNLHIDFSKAEVSLDKENVLLSSTEYRILIQFAQKSGIILSSEYLLETVWGKEYREDKEILWVCISRLRNKLESDPKNPKHIVTIPGFGYTMPLE